MPHGRLYTRQQRLRHEARLMRLATLYGMREPWRTLWVKKASNKYPRWQWMNWERQGYSVQERRLDLQDGEDD